MAKKKKSREQAPTRTNRTAAESRTPSQRQVDKLDREILALVRKRVELVTRRADAGAIDGRNLLAELAHVEEIAGSNLGLDPAVIKSIFREIISGGYAAQKTTKVGYLGPEFTYSHLAAIERFGQSAELIPVTSISAVFEEVECKQVNYGIVPIENSTDGRVADALECLAKSPVQICGEVPLRIRHCLLANCSRASVQRVYSKRQPLSQCRNWLIQHLPDVPLIEVSSSAEAARKAAEDDHAAAIASAQAGANHGVRVQAEGIEDNRDNVTRFAVIGLTSGEKTGHDKTSIVFEIDHKPGALADAMAIFKRQRLNMTWIESFPLPRQRGRYLFFVEFQGHQGELRVRRALSSLGKRALRLTVLGSYAQAAPIG